MATITWAELERALGVRPGERIYDQPNVWQLAADAGQSEPGIYRAKLHPNGRVSVDGTFVTKIAARSSSRVSSLMRQRGNKPIDCYLRADGEWKVLIRV